MTRIDANSFIEKWEAFSESFTRTNTDWPKLYGSNTNWSQCLLGGKRSCLETSPIGNFFRSKFPALRYRREDGSFDLSFSFAPNYSKLQYLRRNDVSHFDAGGFYPPTYDIMLEIENGSRCAWEEMTKLTWVRCPLKVLVTYNCYSSDSIDLENKVLVDNFSNIIHSSNSRLKDNPETEYLLVIGNNTNGNLSWTYFRFDSDGQVQEVKLR